MKTKTRQQQITTASEKHGHRGEGGVGADRKKIKRGRAPKPTKTLRTPNGIPLRAKVSITSEISDMQMETKVVIGYVAAHAIVFDEYLVLTKEVDGFPWLEIPEKLVSKIEYIDPAEECLVKPIALKNLSECGTSATFNSATFISGTGGAGGTGGILDPSIKLY